MNDDRLTFLFQRAVAGLTSAEEQEELLALLAEPANIIQAQGLLKAAWSSYAPGNAVFDEIAGRGILCRILGEENKLMHAETFQKTPFRSWSSPFFRFAALILVVLLVAAYFMYETFKKSPAEEISLAEAVKINQILPGTQKAVLKLDDGRSVDLSGAQKSVRMRKGRVQYEDGSSVIDSEAQFYTVTTPKGGEYQVILPDGSRVHLNAGSSLRYPAKFSAQRREVELYGEAFFEVKATPKYPFFVKSGQQETAALGTSFNIDAYHTHVTATTLVEGSLYVKSKFGKQLVLQANQTVLNEEDKMLIYPADLDITLAWHHGYFMFNDEPIGSIMEKVSRWYNVEIVYEGNMAGRKFGGFFRRSKSLDALLANFKETGIIDFKLEGRRLLVMAK